MGRTATQVQERVDSARKSGPVGVADAGYRRRLERLHEQYLAIPPGAPVRLAKSTSNLFRPRSAAPPRSLDVAASTACSRSTR